MKRVTRTSLIISLFCLAVLFAEAELLATDLGSLWPLGVALAAGILLVAAAQVRVANKKGLLLGTKHLAICRIIVLVVAAVALLDLLLSPWLPALLGFWLLPASALLFTIVVHDGQFIGKEKEQEDETALEAVRRRLRRSNRRWNRVARRNRRRLSRSSFTVTDRIHITDPCYKPGTWCGHFDVPAKSGQWVGKAVQEDEGDWGWRVKLITVHHEAHAAQAEASPAWEALEDIGVDSGQAGVFASQRYEHSEQADATSIKNFYGRACTLTLTKPRFGTSDDGFVSSSGFGDGSYPVHVIREEGCVVAVRIRFIDEE